MSKEVADEYASSLADLTVNRKPLINMLTILAEENIDHAEVIVETVEKYSEKVNSNFYKLAGDNKTLERVIKQRNVINIDVGADGEPARPNHAYSMPEPERIPMPAYVDKMADAKTMSKMPRDDDGVPAKRRRRCGDDAQMEPPAALGLSPAVPTRICIMSSDDTDIGEEDEEDLVEIKKSISIIMLQIKKQFTGGQLDKSQYHTLMYQILQLKEKLQLKEANQRDSVKISKRRLKAHTLEENHKDASPKFSPTERNRFGDIDERVTPSVFLDTPSDSQGMLPTDADSDMRVNSYGVDGPQKECFLPLAPVMSKFGPYEPVWQRPRGPRREEYRHRRFRGPVPPYFRGKFDKRGPRVPFQHRMPIPPLPTHKIGMCQGECPLPPYERSESSPPLGAPGSFYKYFKPTVHPPGLDMLANVMQTDEKPPVPATPLLPPNINVNDLFAKLVATGLVTVKDGKDENGPAQEKTKPEEKIKPREDGNPIHRVDLMRSETLRVKQPGLVAQLYGGLQCSSCSTRFPPEHRARYSQHLDWHFRQNRRQRDTKRRAHSHHWHYDLANWLQYEDVEDLKESSEKSLFETGGLPAPVPLATPSAAACALAQQDCALCGDAFQQFYNEDKEEWHLRNSVRHNDDYYHPACFDDYKASLAKAEEKPSQESTDDITVIEKVEEEAIEIKDVEDVPAYQSDNESVVEVVEELNDLDPVEIDEGEDDDVVFIAVPVEEVVVDDEMDTDDETTAKRKERDRLADTNFSKINVKLEPVDPDDEPVVTHEEEIIENTHIDNTHATLESSIDGNLQLDAANAPVTTIPVGGIRINISGTLPTVVDSHKEKVVEDVSADDEPLPPGEEPELEYTLKPGLEGVTFSRQPMVNRGTELSGLCSIM